MNIAEIRFTAQQSKRGGCKGCLFESRPFKECVAWSDEAIKRGLPDCEDGPGYIYVTDDTDPRQLPLVEVGIRG